MVETRLKHWCGAQGICGLKRAPVLVIPHQTGAFFSRHEKHARELC